MKQPTEAEKKEPKNIDELMAEFVSTNSYVDKDGNEIIDIDDEINTK